MWFSQHDATDWIAQLFERRDKDWVRTMQPHSNPTRLQRSRKGIILGALLGSLLALFGFFSVQLIGHPASAPATAASPTTQSPQVVRFVAIGDAGKVVPAQTRVASAAATVCAQRGCDFGLLLGDNLYNRGMLAADDTRMDDVFSAHKNTGLNWYIALGNHDYAHGLSVDRANWQVDWANRTKGAILPAATYSFDAGPATFVALDTTQVFWENETSQLDWLRKRLARSEQRWRVVFGHHPYRSNGVHGNAGVYEDWPFIPWVSGRTLARLFDGGLCEQADLYLSGHDHSLQWLEHCGTALIVSGAGAGHTALFERGNRAAFQASTDGFVWVELGEKLTVAFFDSTGSLLFEAQRPTPAGR
ncbi:MAG: hypothetical protein GWP91_00580 [Rhodobacterales bacterium]|nr:hypothetical protein [Rhodobacterales bacterium]